MFLLNNITDLVECFLIFLLLGDLLSIFEMLSLETFAVFLVEYAFFLARLWSMGDFLYQQFEGVGYRLVWAKKVSLAAIYLVAGSASLGIREN